MFHRLRSHLVFVVLMLVASPAWAHDPWESNGLAFNPSAPNDLVLRTNRGVAFSTDGGDTWRFLCRVALDNFLPVPGVTTNHSVLLGKFDGLTEISSSGCNETPLNTPMSDLWVSDLALDPSNNSAWFATTSRGGVPNGVFRSENEGRTWSALGELEDGPFFKQLRITTDAQRIYLGMAQYVAPTETEPERVDYSVRVSDDNAAHWQSYPVALEHDDYEMVLLDVDPTNPDRVFVGIHACRETNRCFDRTRGQRMDRVLVSNNRGQTWEPFFEVEEIAAFEINDEYIWIGDWWGGLWRMNRDGSNPVLLDDFLKAGCLVATGDGLLVCGTDVYGFMLARSTDNGDTLVPIATAADILGNPVCDSTDSDAGSLDVAGMCRGEWGDLCFESYMDVPNPPLECAPFLMRDGGTGGSGGNGGLDGGLAPTKVGGGGCDCSTAGSTDRTTPGVSLASLCLVTLGLWLTRSRTRRRSQR